MKNAWIISFIRFPLLILGLLFMFLILKILHLGFHFPFLPELSTVYFTIVNVICFFILTSILKKEGRSVKELVGLRSALIKKDILYGFLWLVVLYIPFFLAVILVMFTMYGANFINHFEIVFAGNIQNYNFFRPRWLMWIVAVAFFLWGIVSGIIYLRQKRLLPLIICHFIVNLIFGILPLFFYLLELISEICERYVNKLKKGLWKEKSWKKTKLLFSQLRNIFYNFLPTFKKYLKC